MKQIYLRSLKVEPLPSNAANTSAVAFSGQAGGTWCSDQCGALKSVLGKSFNQICLGTPSFAHSAVALSQAVTRQFASLHAVQSASAGAVAAAMQADAAYIAKQKLGADWSADRFVPQVKPEIIEPVVEAVTRLDAEVKTRMLISCVLAVGKHSREPSRTPEERQELATQLQRLASACQVDEDSWVKVMAAGARRFDGRLHLKDMESESGVVSGVQWAGAWTKWAAGGGGGTAHAGSRSSHMA